MEGYLKIPYEKAKDISRSNKPASVEFFVQNRDTQMRYTKEAVQSGNYRIWISQLTDEELKQFVKENHERMEKGLTYKTFGPKMKWDLFHRNALYELELLYRANGGRLEPDQLTQWTGEVQGDRVYWEGKYQVAIAQYHDYAKPDDNSSYHTPYY